MCLLGLCLLLVCVGFWFVYLIAFRGSFRFVIFGLTGFSDFVVLCFGDWLCWLGLLVRVWAWSLGLGFT